MPRRHSKTSPAMMTARKRERDALTYRLGGMKQWEIAEKLGVTTQAVSKMLKRVLEETAKEISEDAGKLRAVQLERIEMMIRGLWSRAITGDEKAIDAVRQLLNRQARLLGIDAPQRTEVSGPEGGPIEFSTTEQCIMGKLDRLASEKRKG